jgi:hypothetical protein
MDAGYERFVRNSSVHVQNLVREVHKECLKLAEAYPKYPDTRISYWYGRNRFSKTEVFGNYIHVTLTNMPYNKLREKFDFSEPDTDGRCRFIISSMEQIDRIRLYIQQAYRMA